jgi:Lipoprotein confined to pathogenic Mycobacterium
MHTHRRSALAALLATAAAIALGGCSPLAKETDSVPDQVAQLEEQMRSWPSLEATEEQVTTALHQIADAATAIEPTLHWREHRDRTSGTCKGVYAKTDGVSVHTRALLSDTSIPDATWQPILAEARRIAATIGIDQIEVRIDQPGHHDVRLYSDTWSEIRIASHAAASMVADTGCRFTEQDLKQGSES